MRQLSAFFKKELLEQIRTGKLLILGILFVAFGVMNPAVAKLTPFIMEAFAETLENSGMIITEVTVTAMDSWVQFFKNIPMALIAFVLLEGGIFTSEYQSGTLVLTLTKGLARYKVPVSKAAMLLMLWSLGYWLCFGITYGYNAYYWDNSVAQNLFGSVLLWWIFGIFVISLLVMFSALLAGLGSVLLGVGGTVVASYLIGALPKIGKLLPTFLTDGTSLIYGKSSFDEYLVALAVTLVFTFAALAVSFAAFNKKKI